jgi:integrase
MGRLVQDTRLHNREKRRELRVARKPYWRNIEHGKHIGYRKSTEGGAWIARLYLGAGRYAETRLGAADDVLDADGREVLSWSEAQRKAHEWFLRREAEEVGEPSGSSEKLTVGDALDAYLEWYKVNRKAYADTRYNVEAHIRPALGRIEIRRLTLTRIDRWKAEVAASPLRRRTAKGKPQVFSACAAGADALRARKVTANRNLTILKAALNKLLKDRRLPIAPLWRDAARFSKVDAARPRFLESHEAVRLINACEPAFRSLVQAALVTGARYGELVRLRVGDYRNGKLQVRESKSGKSRWVALSSDGRALFDRLTAGRSTGEVMFLKPARSRAADGAKWRDWGENHQQEPMERACQAARIEPLGFHQLRHTYASLALMSGMPLIVLARNLGHRDARMVEHHYGHLLQSYEDQMIEAHAPRFGFTEAENVATFHRSSGD